ncbi:hypothetical protein WD019_17080 [Fictibacillus sp. Mic-4]|uniref:hypothetical protein n=1 Tax=Fictibacillus TaxID=1329200 RepID=UPI0003F65264|nr:hypothetical protein [Fictibacillus gelatini]
MAEKSTTSIVLYGDIDSSDSITWLEFYNYSLEFAESIGFTPNYLGISGESFKSGKISTIKRTQKRLLTSLEQNESISSISIYSLPENFEVAAFDYNVYICRTNRLQYPHIIITLQSEIFEKIDHKVLVDKLKQFIAFKSGQIFKLSNLESPQIYASKANSLETFKTLEVISDF